MNALPIGGFGIVGVGVSSPPRHRMLPELCASLEHPGVTFNPWHEQTWCQCGHVVRPGNAVVWPKPTDCGGPLVECLHDADGQVAA